MSQSSLESTYQERHKIFNAEAKRLHSKYNKFSLVRLFTFLAAIVIAAILGALTHPVIGVVLFLAFMIAFYFFVQWHQKIQTAQIHNERLATLNQQEENTLKHDYSAYDDGIQFNDPEHPYTIDMDIFGPYSLFQYTNRTSTAIGRKTLADYFNTTVTSPEIVARQKAIQELTPMLDWRQDFQALGLDTEDELRFSNALQEWLQQDTVIYGAAKYKWAMMIVPIISVAGIIAAIFWLPWQVLLLTFLPAAYFLKTTREAIDKIVHQTESVDRILFVYSKLIQHIEEQSFQSKKLRELTLGLAGTGSKDAASAKIKRLSYLVGQLNVRNNIFAIILNLIGLWDLRWTYKLEEWKQEQQHDLGHWFNSMAELETLSSFANLYYNNPEWIFPTIHEQALLETKDFGHPLIHHDKRITNNFTSPTEGHIKLVTGSNMAGKSTFLRTVGLNIILACIGSPVCAKEMRLPILKVYSSMRTQDALHESTSSFYAELKRLKFIIGAVEAGDQIFFLMDEILKGTNSKDRHTGSKALIKQLIKNKGAGIIATHDLELGALEAQYGGAIENLCMEVRVEDGKLFFDYTLEKGVSQSFNATILMQNMGIRIDDIEA